MVETILKNEIRFHHPVYLQIESVRDRIAYVADVAAALGAAGDDDYCGCEDVSAINGALGEEVIVHMYSPDNKCICKIFWRARLNSHDGPVMRPSWGFLNSSQLNPLYIVSNSVYAD